MKSKLLVAASLGVLVAACASGPEPAPPEPAPPPQLDPTGTFDMTVYAQGMEIGGVLAIQGSAQSGYTGTVETDIGGGAISNVVVDDQTLTFTLAEFGAEFEVIFEGDEFTGYVASGMGDGDVYGVRRSGG